MFRGLTILLVSFLVFGCGAPTKSAGDVSSIFSEGSASLQEKVDELCDKLDNRSAPPTTQDVNVPLENCSNAGQSAQNYNSLTKFNFAGVDDRSFDTSDDEISASGRGQIWINRSLIGFASSVMNQMKKSKEDGSGLEGMASTSNGKGDSISNLAQVKISENSEPSINTETFEFTTDINLKMSGVIEADLDLVIKGALLDEQLAITIVGTKADADSFITSFDGLVLIVPHAGDVYMDFFSRVKVQNVGMESLIKSQINSALGSGMKTLVDSLLAI